MQMNLMETPRLRCIHADYRCLEGESVDCEECGQATGQHYWWGMKFICWNCRKGKESA